MGLRTREAVGMIVFATNKYDVTFPKNTTGLDGSSNGQEPIRDLGDFNQRKKISTKEN